MVTSTPKASPPRCSFPGKPASWPPGDALTTRPTLASASASVVSVGHNRAGALEPDLQACLALRSPPAGGGARG